MLDETTVGCGFPIATARPPAGTACLIVVTSPKPSRIGEILRLEAGDNVVGRGSGAGCQVEDPGVSRQHARILRRVDGACVLSDLGSTNGTYVNGVRVKEALLREGDRIQVGTVTALRFSLRDRLEEGEERLRRALGAAKIATWEWQLRSGELNCSDEANVLGSGASGDVALRDRLHPDDRATVDEALADAARRGAPCEIECRLAAAADGERWVTLRGDLFRDERGAPVRIAGMLLDVTERKRAERELRRQALLFESIGDGVVLFALDGAVLDANPSAERMLGADRAALRGRPVGAALDADAERLTESMLAGLAAEGRWAGEVALPRARGRRTVLEVRALPLRDREGLHIANVALARDVGEIREMQARLLLADRMASLGTLAAGMAHEINNPLAFVLANLAFLRAELERLAPRLPDEDRRALDAVLHDTAGGAERIRGVVQDLGIFSRGLPAQVEDVVDVNAVVEFALKMADNEIRHRARLVRALGPVPPVAGGDARLGQVVLNLLVNAAQAIAEGDAARNEIRVATSADADGHVVIEVSDTGCGIDPEALPRIFDPFYTTKPVGRGTGLGLSISHRIGSARGGESGVESRPGRGSEFRVRLPAARADLRVPPAAVPSPAGRARVLVVDAEKTVGAAIARFLGRRHDVAHVERADEALRRVRSGERYDLVLCDLMMPEVTGMELHDRVAAEWPEQAERFVFMTGGAFTAGAQRFVESSSVPVVSKPVDLDRLEGLVQARLAAATG